MTYTVKLPSSVQDSVISISDRTPSTISFTVENYVSKTVEVKADVTAVEVADGYMLDSTTFDYDTVNVAGPESIVSRITNAQIVMSRTDLDKTVTETMDYNLVDENGDTIDKTGLTLDVEKIETTLNVVKYKEIPLDVAFIDGGGAPPRRMCPTRSAPRPSRSRATRPCSTASTRSCSATSTSPTPTTTRSIPTRSSSPTAPRT
jgi:hypothetical protein